MCNNNAINIITNTITVLTVILAQKQPVALFKTNTRKRFLLDGWIAPVCSAFDLIG